jgi:hypothetical protein
MLQGTVIYGATTGRRCDPARRTTVGDVKETYREGEQAAKETWRKLDGNESVEDKLGNVGDEFRKEAGNTGDDLREGARREADQDRADLRRSDGEESLADKAGNAGDTFRRELDRP